MLNWDCKRFLEQLFDANLRALKTNILICIFWRLLEALILAVPGDVMLVSDTSFFGFLFILLS
jgi:U3 small nucleolar RNA-associated protein 10